MYKTWLHIHEPYPTYSQIISSTSRNHIPTFTNHIQHIHNHNSQCVFCECIKLGCISMNHIQHIHKPYLAHLETTSPHSQTTSNTFTTIILNVCFVNV